MWRHTRKERRYILRMALGLTGTLPRRWSDCSVNVAMTVLLAQLLILAALSASRAAVAAPMSGSAARPWQPAAPLGLGARLGGASLTSSRASSLGDGFGGGGLGTLEEQAETELARYALIMLDPAASGADSAAAGTITRRITPKSVFIAPSINGDREPCAEGYQQDEMGRCVRVVKVDADKSWDLLLEKLNNQFAELALPLPELGETTPRPGPPPGPFQLAIPIAGVAAPAAPTASPSGPQPSTSPEPATEAATTEAEQLAATTLAPPARAEGAEGETESPPTTGEPPLLPEVVMLSSEEQPPVAQSGAALVTDDRPAPEAAPTEKPANQTDHGDTNPIINTVNSSPLVTGDSLTPEVDVVVVPSASQLVGEESSQQQAAQPNVLVSSTTGSSVDSDFLSLSTTSAPSPSSTEAYSTSSTTTAPTSSTTEAPSSVEIVEEGEVEDQEEDEIALPTPDPEPQNTSSTTTSATPALSSSTTEPSTSVASSTASWASSDESRPSSANMLRPEHVAVSRIPVPVIAPDPDAIRFPTTLTERPTLFKTPTAFVRFPQIDVTFPTSPGGAAGGGGDVNRLPLGKPVVFPKDDKSSVWWPPLPPAPSFVTNWGLEQTRNRPQQQHQHQHQHLQQHSGSRSPALQYRYRSRYPSRLSYNPGLGLGLTQASAGPNALSTTGGTSTSSSSLSALSSSSSSSSSSSQESGEARRRTLSYAHSPRGSRRGREWSSLAPLAPHHSA